MYRCLYQYMCTWISGQSNNTFCTFLKLCSICILWYSFYTSKKKIYGYQIHVFVTLWCSFSFYRIHRAALWILGEYCETNEDIQNVMTMIRQAIGEVNLQWLLPNFLLDITFKTILQNLGSVFLRTSILILIFEHICHDKYLHMESELEYDGIGFMNMSYILDWYDCFVDSYCGWWDKESCRRGWRWRYVIHFIHVLFL